MLKKISQKLITAIKMPLYKKVWFVILYPISGVGRFASLVLSLKKVFWYLGYTHGNAQLCIPASQEQLILAYKISKTAHLVSRYVPWESKCLIDAIMVKTLLKYYKIRFCRKLSA